MAKILIVYYSRSGHTEKMADAVKAGAEAAGATATLKAVGDATLDDLIAHDGVILGSPTYYGHPAAELKQFVDESVKLHGQLTGKVGGAFASAGVLGGGPETTVRAMLDMLLVHGMVVQGTHQGGHFGPTSIGAPDEKATRECEALGARAANLATRLAG